jgi:hypothetical protein
MHNLKQIVQRTADQLGQMYHNESHRESVMPIIHRACIEAVLDSMNVAPKGGGQLSQPEDRC